MTFILVFFSERSLSQSWNCATVPPGIPLTNELTAKGLSTLSVSSKIAFVYFHIIRNSNGTGGLTSGEVNNVLTILRQDFASSQICFVEKGRAAINDDYYTSSFSLNKFHQLVTVNRKADALNIYLLPKNVWVVAGSPTGRADGIPGNALVIDGTLANTSVISHETGHCLGLYHTHHGTFSEGGDSEECPELANGANSATCGDYITDTPADPRIWNGCQYAGTASDVDANGHPYNPDTDNIMSYVSPSCLDVFTPQQTNRMHTMINDNFVVRNTLVKIDGPDRVPCMANATYSVPSITGAAYTWSVQSPLQILSGQGTNSILVSSTSPAFTSKQISLFVSSCSSTPVIKAVGAAVPEAAQYLDIYDAVNPQSLCPNRTYRVEASGYDHSYSEFYWVLPEDWSSPDGGNGDNTFTTYGSSGFMIQIRTGSQPTTGSISVRAVNACGIGDPKTRGVSTMNCPFSSIFSVYPNPANQNLTVTLSKNFQNNIQNQDTQNYTVKLFSTSQTLLRSTTMPAKGKVVFNTADLSSGLYYLHVSDGNTTYKEQVAVFH